MVESFRPSYVSNGEGSKKGINNHCNEIDTEQELDADYERYMSSLKPGYDDYVIGESSSVQYTCSSGRRWERTSIDRTDDDECGSDLEILAVNNLPFREGQYSPFVSSKCYQLLADEDCWVGNDAESQFREKLMDLLEIPYDEDEYENLWQLVTKKGRVQGLRELRGGISKLYSRKTEGKSYLDWFIDLKEKVDEFNHDQPKILYLLRGFFLWLKETAHEGAFKPWLDSEFLNALG